MFDNSFISTKDDLETFFKCNYFFVSIPFQMSNHFHHKMEFILNN